MSDKYAHLNIKISSGAGRFVTTGKRIRMQHDTVTRAAILQLVKAVVSVKGVADFVGGDCRVDSAEHFKETAKQLISMHRNEDKKSVLKEIRLHLVADEESADLPNSSKKIIKDCTSLYDLVGMYVAEVSKTQKQEHAPAKASTNAPGEHSAGFNYGFRQLVLDDGEQSKSAASAHKKNQHETGKHGGLSHKNKLSHKSSVEIGWSDSISQERESRGSAIGRS